MSIFSADMLSVHTHRKQTEEGGEKGGEGRGGGRQYARKHLDGIETMSNFQVARGQFF